MFNTLYLVEDDFNQHKIFNRKKDAINAFADLYEDYIRQYNEATENNCPLSAHIDKDLIDGCLDMYGYHTNTLDYSFYKNYDGSGQITIEELNRKGR